MKEINVNSMSFEELRTRGDYIYVDKTEYVYSLVRRRLNNYYSIARPHNFGKSLMCSTLQALFEGKRELFKGLYIDSTDYSFEKYPVLHFNFAEFRTESYERFIEDFQNEIISQTERNGIHVERKGPSSMLKSFLYHVEKKTAIIIDNYDTPIIRTYKDTGLAEKINETLFFFYNVIKNSDDKVRFFFLTGIKKYVNMSMFSGMNNLTDLTFDPNYASAFGYTEEELESNFSDYIDEYMKRDDREYETREEFISAIRDYYDGYRFSYRNETRVYNPVSVGKFFNSGCEFESYWINTGASTLAVELAKDYQLEKIIREDLKIGLSTINSFDYSNMASKKLNSSQILSLMYFAGYLTIKEGNNLALTLTFPNKEVRFSFTESLMNLYSDQIVGAYLDDANTAIRNNDTSRLIKVLNAFYENIPYVILPKEVGYQGMFYAFFLLMGAVKIHVEEETLLGRIDAVIELKDSVYVIEIKVDQSSGKAIKQIKEKRYYGKYINTDKVIHIVGLNFSSSDRQIKDWKEEIIDKTKEPTYLG